MVWLVTAIPSVRAIASATARLGFLVRRVSIRHQVTVSTFASNAASGMDRPCSSRAILTLAAKVFASIMRATMRAP